jgi:ABC-type multidrug transport system fused ATPase/permease subunit
MQSIIQSEFKHHTIIMIAHRLSSLLEFDQVVMLEHGQLVEIGNPHDLLKDKRSRFYGLYHGSTAR